jgi:dihydrofolate reductase
MPTPQGAKISFVAAIGSRRELGLYQGVKGMPWSIPEDLAHFHHLTAGHAVVMGRRTFDVIGHPLAGRTNVVITRDLAFRANGVLVAHSVDEALRRAGDLEEDEIFIIGGAQIFEETLPLADKLYLTIVDGEFDADVFFPPYPDFTKVVFREEHTSGPYRFTYLDLERE